MLFLGISPEIGIMKINEKLHSALSGTSAYFRCGPDVAVTSAVAVTAAVEWVVPDADADIVYPVICENFK